MKVSSRVWRIHLALLIGAEAKAGRSLGVVADTLGVDPAVVSRIAAEFRIPLARPRTPGRCPRCDRLMLLDRLGMVVPHRAMKSSQVGAQTTRWLHGWCPGKGELGVMA